MNEGTSVKTNELDPESLVILKDTFEKIILKEKGFQKALEHLKLTDFMNECKTYQSKSAKARQQKKRLKVFFKQTWNLDDEVATSIIQIIELRLQEHSIPDFLYSP